MTAPAPLDWRARPAGSDRALILFKVIMVFALLGPPLGALTFLALLTFGLGLAHDPNLAGAVATFGFLALFAVPTSYVLGGLPALIVGGAIGMWQAFRGPASFGLAGAVGLVGALGIAGSGHWPFSDASFRGRDDFALVLLTCLIPTLICWYLVRHAAIRPPEESP